jgi:hypothetical protein
MSLLTCNDRVNLLRNLKTNRHKRLNLDDRKFTTPQHTCEERKAKISVKVEAKTGELGIISWSEINYGIF